MMGVRVRGPLADRVRYLDGRSMGAQINRSMRKLLERLAADRPHVVLFEDLHWADASSLELIEHLLPLTRRMPLVFVCVTRPEEDGALRRLGAVARREDPQAVAEIALAGLTRGAAERLLENLVGERLDPATAGALLRRAEGNPFFLEELVRSLIASGGLERTDDGGWRATRALDARELPETVQGVIMARVTGSRRTSRGSCAWRPSSGACSCAACWRR